MFDFVSTASVLLPYRWVCWADLFQWRAAASQLLSSLSVQHNAASVQSAGPTHPHQYRPLLSTVAVPLWVWFVKLKNLNFLVIQSKAVLLLEFIICCIIYWWNLLYSGRCTVMSDLRVITFDGNNVALYDNGSYILVNMPRETIIGTVEKCPTSQVTCKQ